MAGNAPYQEIMLQAVADALGHELLPQMAFVGGCTTALLITDPVTREGVRFTEDVDLIVHVIGYGGWHTLLNQLRHKGFTESPKDDITCRLRLKRRGHQDLIVDSCRMTTPFLALQTAGIPMPLPLPWITN